MTLAFASGQQAASGLDIQQFIELSPIAVLRLDTAANLVEANRAFFTLMRDSIPTTGPLSFIDMIDAADRPAFTEALEQLMKASR